MASSDAKPVPISRYQGWIIGLRRSDPQRGLYWGWWDGKVWGPLTESKRFDAKDDADAESVGLTIAFSDGEVRVTGGPN